MNELPNPVATLYDYIKENPGDCLDTIKENSGYSIITIRRFIRTLISAELVIIDPSSNLYYVIK